jgi:hypothetical protein
MVPVSGFFTAAAVCLLVATSAWGFGPGAKGYVGSGKCRECHEEIYREWKLTPHANMLRDAKKNPDAVAARDFTGVPFGKGEVWWTIGSHWIQKYLTFIDNDYYVLPKYWNLVNGDWEPYSIFNWRERPYTIYCDGCHTTGFDAETKSFHEPSIGCEACHGPGEEHVGSGGDAKDIVNPAKLTNERRDMICEACHTDGKDTKAGGQFPFPAGFRPGEDIKDYFTEFFAPKPKSKKWYWGTVDYKERHRMFLFWQSKFYSTARACEVCGFDRGITVKEERYMSRDEYCGTCHGKIYKIRTLHSKHPTEVSPQCVDCHPPRADRSGERYSIHDHRFDFTGPELPCAECHDNDDPRLGKKPSHEYNLSKGKPLSVGTMEDACKRCHGDRKGKDSLSSWKNKRISVE